MTADSFTLDKMSKTKISSSFGGERNEEEEEKKQDQESDQDDGKTSKESRNFQATERTHFLSPDWSRFVPFQRP